MSTIYGYTNYVFLFMKKLLFCWLATSCVTGHLVNYQNIMSSYVTCKRHAMLHFAWADQRDKVCFVFHKISSYEVNLLLLCSTAHSRR